MQPCAECGEIHERNGTPTCIGHTSAGLPCKMYPIRGGTVCYKRHGGKAPQVQAAARERIERQRAEQAVATYGLPIDIDPFDALREELARTHGHVKWLAQIVSEMEPIDLVWGDTMEKEELGEGTSMKGGDTTSTTRQSEAGLSVWLKLYRDERAHEVMVCKTAIGCGIAQREIELLERYGDMMANVLSAIVDDPELALDAMGKDKLLAVASRHLRAA